MSRLKSSSTREGLLLHKGHTGYVMSVAFSPDGQSVLSGSGDETVRFWDANSSSPRGKPWKGHTNPIASVSYSPLGNLAASGSWDNTIRLWDTNTGLQAGEPLRGHYKDVNSVAFSPSDNLKLIASGSNDETIRLWNVQTRKPASRPFKGHDSGIHSVIFSPDGTRLISGSEDGNIQIWDVERGATILTLDTGHSAFVNSVASSPDGSQVVSGADDATFRLWDTRGGRIIGNPYIGHTSHVLSVAFSPDGTYVASGSWDHTVRIWDVRTGRQVDTPFKEHTGGVRSVVFSPCGKRIASGSADKTVMIWRVSGNDLDVEQASDTQSRNTLEFGAPLSAYLGSGSERIVPDRSADETSNQPMSVQEILSFLSRHGCIDLRVNSHMDPNQPSAVLISGGGFGDIWRGELLDRTKVAIKTWRGSVVEHCDYKLLKRATREIYYWSRMKHENVHQLMGVIAFRGQSLGMVSEWMENGNLHEYLRRNPSANRLQLSIQVASGLAHVHSYNMVHGDLKSLNVLISPSGTAKLTDFGLSTMAEASIAFSETSSMQIGSLRWAAPELLLEESPKTEQTDIYSLGMTILEIFTGTVPYSQCQRDYVVLSKVQQGILPARPLKHIKEDEPGNQIWELLLRCWDRKPVMRPSATEVGEYVGYIVEDW